jgi:2',3'-cyclic-nucleotide 2'-phosphodiesterase (5'-nucleotidase family)
VEADGKRPPGSRVTAIRVGGAPLDDARTYRVATNDFIARGGDGYSMFTKAPRLLADSDAPLLANEVMTFLRRLGTVKTGVEGRIVVA